MRNHAGDTSIFQEFYRWPLTQSAARNAINIRYRLLDYIYTAFHRQTQTGLPLLNPLFFHYPEDANTFAIEHQFFYGDDILVSPVLEENSTDVSIYLPNGIFYDWWTLEQVVGTGSWINISDVAFDSIPLHIRGGAILPLRAESANTTTELRKQDFVIWIAPNATGQASGSLYLDDGDSIEQDGVSEIVFTFDNGRFSMTGDFGYETDLQVKNITLLGADGQQTLQGPVPLTGEYSVTFNGTGGNYTGGGNPPQFEGAATRSSVGALMGAIAGAVFLAL